MSEEELLDAGIRVEGLVRGDDDDGNRLYEEYIEDDFNYDDHFIDEYDDEYDEKFLLPPQGNPITNYVDELFYEYDITNNIVKLVLIIAFAYIIAQLISILNIHVNYSF